tara:strand:- start:119 stop:694 length:576 start_codon:yes stop_codon:yes gene_type:complete
MNIAIIPARKNSKRIKNKNIKSFFGKPVISYAIKCAKKSKLFDKIIVSTDSEKIVKIAKKFGAEAPFLRPKKFSTDKALTIDVIKHAIKWLKERQINPKYVCCIYPATPLMKVEDLIKSFLIVKKNKHDFIISSAKFSYPIEKSFQINNHLIKLFRAHRSSTMTQKLKNYYHDAGQFYWGRTNKWLKKKKY